jgi:thymidylate synthase
MNQLDLDYQNLLKDILDNGVKKETRNGGTLSVFGRQIRHKMSDGFPAITTKKLAFKTMVTELLWFLRGETNIKYLVDNNCNIWTGDAYKSYENKYYKGEAFGYKKLNDSEYSPDLKLSQEEFINKIKTDDEFAKKYGELGKIYGHGWRNWGSEFSLHIGLERDGSQDKINFKQGIDQIANLISELKTNPDSRRLLVSAWNVADVESGSMVLPPCHYSWQVYTRELSFEERKELMVKYTNDNSLLPIGFSVPFGEESNKKYLKVCDSYNIPTRAISLCWNQRSVDTGLGLSFNIASYSLLLMMIAKQVNMIPDEVIGNLGDVHLYLNHIEPIKEQLTREPYPLPTVKISDRVVNDISEYTLDDIILENYQSHPTIKMPLSN